MPALAALLEGTVVPYLRSVRELLADLKATTYNRYERLQILKGPTGRWSISAASRAIEGLREGSCLKSAYRVRRGCVLLTLYMMLEMKFEEDWSSRQLGD
jgi:hypothetical protein